MADIKFVRVAGASSIFENDLLVATLERAQIRAISHAHGFETSDRFTSATQPWWEISVPEVDLDRATTLVESERERQRAEAAEAEQAALTEYAAAAPSGEGAVEVPETVAPVNEARPEIVTLAGYMFFGTIAFEIITTIGWRARGLSLGGFNMPKYVGAAITLLLGYALSSGPREGRFWRRARIIAFLWTLLAALSVGALVPMDKGFLGSTVAECVLLVTLVAPNRWRTFLLAAFILSGIGVVFSAIFG